MEDDEQWCRIRHVVRIDEPVDGGNVAVWQLKASSAQRWFAAPRPRQAWKHSLSVPVPKPPGWVKSAGNDPFIVVFRGHRTHPARLRLGQKKLAKKWPPACAGGLP
jgi:hypothetical protein